jgi:hypothetical protein
MISAAAPRSVAGSAPQSSGAPSGVPLTRRANSSHAGSGAKAVSMTNSSSAPLGSPTASSMPLTGSDVTPPEAP